MLLLCKRPGDSLSSLLWEEKFPEFISLIFAHLLVLLEYLNMWFT